MDKLFDFINMFLLTECNVKAAVFNFYEQCGFLHICYNCHYVLELWDRQSVREKIKFFCYKYTTLGQKQPSQDVELNAVNQANVCAPHTFFFYICCATVSSPPVMNAKAS